MEKFDEPRIVVQIRRLDQLRKGGFALACASRLSNAIRVSKKIRSSDIRYLLDCTETLWDLIVNERLNTDNLGHMYDRIIAFQSEEDDAEWDQMTSYFDDAIATLAYSIRTLIKNDPQEAAWAARRGYEAVDRFAQHDLNISQFSQESEKLILQHPYVQNELRRQRIDLDSLSQPGIAKEILLSIQAKAFEEPSIPDLA